MTILSATAAMAQGLPTPAFPERWQMNLQTAVTPVAERLHWFHNYLLFWCLVISVFVLLLLIWVAIRYNAKANPVPSKNSHNTLLEVVWTVIPILILVAIAVPSYRLLYYMDRIDDAEVTVKVIGNQWFWSYEFPDYDISLDSLPLADDEIDTAAGQHRLLEVTDPLILPVDTDIRIQFTSNDVIHAWTIPAFGVKLDNVPGRINETWTRIEVPGKYYGQCSELCGIDHSFMPIVVHAVSREEFEAWKNEEMADNGNNIEAAPTRLAAASE